jgi:3-isopropylmalate/(R)-2-methylmalate dehydratase small subunit
MERFTRLDAIACPLGLANVDTDQLIPARFMKRSRAEGYGGYLLHDLRFAADGSPLPGFALNDPRHSGAKVLVTRRNFGTGSSREAAVYALWDYGIRCVVAPGFGDIFASNAVRNGLLPATVSEPDAEVLLAALGAAASPRLSVDLELCMILAEGVGRIPFGVDPVRRQQLLNGWDDIDLTERHRAAIDTYRAARRQAIPWSWPG